ncbi:HAD-IIB family hydrolase [Sunxiuqinia sp. sy24]|uniref:HAD-IIB family hydrolase n=1 Tax=Sunxiuqinia sp. sy24 TaxID=3461495 RepID=UPI0040464979
MMKDIRLVATDLDGTFLKNDKSISDEDIQMLEVLGERQVLRVVATGRNFKKVLEVLPDHLPFDYVAFSSGAGIYDWKNRKLVYRQNLKRETTEEIIRFLIDGDMNFHLFRAVPDNFRCWFYRGNQSCEEFDRYFDFHNSVSEELPANQKLESNACQFLVIFPNDPEAFLQTKQQLEARFDDIKVVRTSSPLDTDYIWMEIFHKDVSKGNAVKFLCEQKRIQHHMTFGIGNDYNDLDLLNFTSYSYLVENGPEELKPHYRRALSNENSAFSHSLKKYL